jgi:spermidine synthase
MYSHLWIEERYKDFYGMKYKVENVLFAGKSDFQTVDVVVTKGHGKMLLNDGLVMVSEKDEFIYHDMIAHPALFSHPNPENVLIIGGGDGGTAREVLRHKGVKKCTMVEIDEMVVNACIEHIPQTSSVLVGENPRMNLIIGDGVQFVKDAQVKGEKYDVILVDSTDPIGPAQPLFGKEFYQDIYNCLTDNGIVVSQGESPFFEVEMQTKLMSILHSIFPVSKIYNFHNLTYPGGLWSFTYASKGIDPIDDLDSKRVEESGLEFGYYSAPVHKAAFVLPTFMRNNLLPYLQ